MAWGGARGKVSIVGVFETVCPRQQTALSHNHHLVVIVHVESAASVHLHVCYPCILLHDDAARCQQFLAHTLHFT